MRISIAPTCHFLEEEDGPGVWGEVLTDTSEALVSNLTHVMPPMILLMSFVRVTSWYVKEHLSVCLSVCACSPDRANACCRSYVCACVCVCMQKCCIDFLLLVLPLALILMPLLQVAVNSNAVERAAKDASFRCVLLSLSVSIQSCVRACVRACGDILNESRQSRLPVKAYEHKW